MDLVSVLRLSLLLDAYGALLTPKQVSVLNSYINFNGSLSEIALELNVTRQAVGDLIRRTNKLLENYEAKLKLLEKLNKTRALIFKADNASSGEPKCASNKLESELEGIWGK